jgi:pantoate--beta-alanine ligase
MTGLAQPEEFSAARLERVESVAAVRGKLRGWRAAGQRIALVPTMGNLHSGHLSLIETAAQHVDQVVTSIFVNPTQFGPDEDIGTYPRTPAEDEALLNEQRIAGLLFAPSVAEVYPHGTDDAVSVKLPPLAADLCGRRRPGHFDGVASVVLRFLNIIEPEVLVLGRKDYQQLVLVTQMIEDLHLDVELVSSATVREPDGLAMSSRNKYLTPAERDVAPQLFAQLTAVADAVRDSAADFDRPRKAAIAALEREGFSVDYLELRNARDLSDVSAAQELGERVLLVAARLGRARLIDNVTV